MMRTTPVLQLLLIALAAVFEVSAQRSPAPASDLEVNAAATVAAVARNAIGKYEERDRTTYLDGLFRLQIAAGDYADAAASLDALLEILPATPSDARDRLAAYQLYAEVKASPAAADVTFAEAFQLAFRDRVRTLDDKTAFRLLDWFALDLDAARNNFQAAFAGYQGQATPSVQDAIALARRYVLYTVFREIQPFTGGLIAEDDSRRYSVQDDLEIRTPDGATISGFVVRPRRAAGPLPTAFTFTIYASTTVPQNARRAAAHGYAGVVAFTRGKGRSPDEPIPYEHDGSDARAVIEWITHQPWSNGSIGMFGGSYDGFTQWATAKHPPPALKTIVPYVAAIPGLGLPMENNVFLNANYGWTFYVTNNKYLDDKTYNNPQRWSSLNARWYASGRAYSEYDSVDGTPNKWFHRWLKHPAFDAYWQSMTAYRSDFSRINIPVLTITGYYDDGQISALQYVKEHYKYNSKAEHYLLIGPWDHFGSQAATKPSTLRGYTIDPVAQVDTPEITFQWLDYVLRGGRKPELLRDRINYEEMGSNQWKQAPTLAAMYDSELTLYLTDTKSSGPYYRLADQKPASPRFLIQTIDFADRHAETNNYYPAPIVGKKPNLSSALAFISEPFPAPVSVAGTLSGVLNARINKKDMDVGMVLYEVMPDGTLFQLTYFLGRASFARDMTARHLLTPGRIEAIPFDRTRLVVRRLEAGSRLLVVLDVNKNAFHEVNYGTGKDVSTESIADATQPLRVEWRTDSYVKVPIAK